MVVIVVMATILVVAEGAAITEEYTKMLARSALM